MTDREKILEGFSEFLQFLKDTPDVPLPYTMDHPNIWFHSRQDFADAARKLGHGEKGKGYTCIYLRKMFGVVKVDLCMSNETAQCRKVITGTRHVPEHVVAAHDEPVEEWICDEALLAMDKGAK